MVERGYDVKSFLLADDSLDYQEPLQKLVNYSLWITLAICALGVVIVAAKIAIGYLNGDPQGEAFGLFWVLGGCVLAMSASGIAATFVG